MLEGHSRLWQRRRSAQSTSLRACGRVTLATTQFPKTWCVRLSMMLAAARVRMLLFWSVLLPADTRHNPRICLLQVS